MDPSTLASDMAQRTDWDIVDPGTGKPIPITKSGVMGFTTGASGETNTLANPTRPGIQLTLTCKTHGGGDRVVTAAGAINASGNTIITFNTTRDTVHLLSIPIAAGAYRWEVVVNSGASLS